MVCEQPIGSTHDSDTDESTSTIDFRVGFEEITVPSTMSIG
jgi:hypothetical protein